MSERVQGVITQGGQDISAICNVRADGYACPPRVLVALGIAESNLNEYAARERAWPDVSYSIWQQTVKWAAGYGVGDGTDTTANRAAVRTALTVNLDRAADIAARQLGHWWGLYPEPIQAMCRYNRPSTPASENANRPNYERAWAQSARYVVQASDAEEETPMSEFTGGFADLADQLGEDVVGRAVQPEFSPNGDSNLAMQVTSKGLMVWGNGGPALFLPAVSG